MRDGPVPNGRSLLRERARDYLVRRSIFSHQDFVDSVLGAGARTKRTIDALLAAFLDEGRLIRVARGWYAVVPDGESPSTGAPDRYLVACIASDAVVGYQSALAFRRLVPADSDTITLVSERHFTPFSFRGTWYRRVVPPKALRKCSQLHYGVRRETQSGSPVWVSTRERAFVDMLSRPRHASGLVHAWRTLSQLEHLDVEEVLAYLAILNNATTTATVGLFLEQQRAVLGVDEAVLSHLRERRPPSPHYVERGLRAPLRLVPSWNLILPESVAMSARNPPRTRRQLAFAF